MSCQKAEISTEMILQLCKFHDRVCCHLHTVSLDSLTLCFLLLWHFQECMCLIRRLCVEEGGGTELADKLAENLEEILSDNKVRLSNLVTVT